MWALAFWDSVKKVFFFFFTKSVLSLTLLHSYLIFPGVNIWPKYYIFAPPPISKNYIFPLGTVKILSFSPFFHLFPLIFALFLNKSSYFFPQPANNSYFILGGWANWKLLTPEYFIIYLRNTSVKNVVQGIFNKVAEFLTRN